MSDCGLPANVGSMGGLGVLVMRPMRFTNEHGDLDPDRAGWYIDGPGFYCDVERDAAGQWSVFFRECRSGAEAYGEKTPNVSLERLPLGSPLEGRVGLTW